MRLTYSKVYVLATLLLAVAEWFPLSKKKDKGESYR